MSKRFDVKTCMMQEDEGKYVLYSEYAALEAELAQQTDNTVGPKLADDMESFAVACDRAGNRRDARKVRAWVSQLQAIA